MLRYPILTCHAFQSTRSARSATLPVCKRSHIDPEFQSTRSARSATNK